jgi:hypothetical protein
VKCRSPCAASALCQLAGNEFSLPSANHQPRALQGAPVERVRIMLRLKIVASAVPLIAAAILARIELVPSQRPCIAIGTDTLQLASAPWHADLHVSFTDDPALATVRVALTDRAETADFAVIDDADETEDATCTATPSTQFVAVSAHRSIGAPMIYLSPDESSADYRIFVRSKHFSAHEAAALIVGAHSDRPQLAAGL